MAINVEASHKQFVENRRQLERSEGLPHFAARGRGLSADQARAETAQGKKDFHVHFSRVAKDGPMLRSIHPAEAEPGPDVEAVLSLDDALADRADALDLTRARRLAAVDKNAPNPLFEGGPIAKDAEARHLERVRAVVYADAKQIRGGARDYGLPEVQPPIPSSNGKLSLEHVKRYGEEQAALDGILDLEAERLRGILKHVEQHVDANAPTFALDKIRPQLDTMPAATRQLVEQTITKGTPGQQADLFVATRPITDRDGNQALAYVVRRFDPEAGGRPTRESLAQEFGLANEAGIRVVSVAELVDKGRQLLREELYFGSANMAAFPHHRGMLPA